MSFKQRRPSASDIHHNPSTSFSTVSSAASATSIGSTRSGGSRLLFGEIDVSSDRSSETVASVCSLVLSDSSTFLKFWLTDRCRESLISALPKQDLANLRLVCHDFSTRAAPTLFQDLRITFRASTFTRPARLAALDRLGFHVKHLTFNIPHTPETSLPPLIHPETGEEVNFTYTPQTGTSNTRQAKYGDEEITELLVHQYPPLFHAATNVPAFIRGLSSFFNLSHLEISCPGSENALNDSRRSTVDFALISLRIAIERSCLNALDTLTLAPIHPAGLLSLSPLSSCGATPASAKRSCIKHLSISTPATTSSSQAHHPTNPTKLLTSYLSPFRPHLRTLAFAWLGTKGPLPFHHQRKTTSRPATPHSHPAHPRRCPQNHQTTTPTTLHFPSLTHLKISNSRTRASNLRTLALQHTETLQTLGLNDVELMDGTWEEAFAPLLPSTPKDEQHAGRRRGARGTFAGSKVEMAEIPIMFAPQSPPRTPPKPSLLPSLYPSRPSAASVAGNGPTAQLQQARLQPQFQQRIHPSARGQASPQSQSQSSAQSPGRERESCRRQPVSFSIPASVPASPARAGRAGREAAPVVPQKGKKGGGGIFGRVARGVKRTFGG